MASGDEASAAAAATGPGLSFAPSLACPGAFAGFRVGGGTSAAAPAADSDAVPAGFTCAESTGTGAGLPDPEGWSPAPGVLPACGSALPASPGAANKRRSGTGGSPGAGDVGGGPWVPADDCTSGPAPDGAGIEAEPVDETPAPDLACRSCEACTCVLSRRASESCRLTDADVPPGNPGGSAMAGLDASGPVDDAEAPGPAEGSAAAVPLMRSCISHMSACEGVEGIASPAAAGLAGEVPGGAAAAGMAGAGVPDFPEPAGVGVCDAVKAGSPPAAGGKWLPLAGRSAPPGACGLRAPDLRPERSCGRSGLPVSAARAGSAGASRSADLPLGESAGRAAQWEFWSVTANLSGSLARVAPVEGGTAVGTPTGKSAAAAVVGISMQEEDAWPVPAGSTHASRTLNLWTLTSTRCRASG